MSAIIIDIEGHNRDRSLQNAQLQVTRVYSGDPDLLKTTISDTAQTGRSLSIRSELAYPEYAPSENGIFVLARSKESGWRVVQRFRQPRSESYAARQAWAETIEKLTTCTEPERQAKARAMCIDRSPLLANLGVQLLVSAGTPEAFDFVKALPNTPGVSTRTLIETDQLLLAADPKGWTDTEKRANLLAAITAVQAEDDAIAASHYLHYISQRGVSQLPPQQAIAWIGVLLRSRAATEKARLIAVQDLLWLAQRDRLAVPVFDLFATTLRSEDNAAVRLAVARALPGLVDLAPRPRLTPMNMSPAQQDIYRSLQKREKDAQVAGYIQTALEKAGAPSDRY